MVIVKLRGGLGNQMFQYAAGRQLAILHQTTLKLDISIYRCGGLRSYDLEAFRIEGKLAKDEEVARIRAGRNLVTRFASWLGLPRGESQGGPVFRETGVKPFNPSIAETPGDVYLDGYWQSEKYFADISDVIRREFTVRSPLVATNLRIAEMISNTQSVSIHVRRGDYVSNPATARVHGVCSLDYYRRCMALIAERIGRPHFYVFSDDPDWVMENLRSDHPCTCVTHNDASHGHEDLRLMTMCEHNIIANSSFSWWGAWLNVNPDKLVFAPQEWFRDRSIDTRDLLPVDWIRVSAQ